MMWYRMAGQHIHRAYLVPVWYIVALIVAWHTATLVVGTALDTLPPCMYTECEQGTQMLVILYRFLAGN